MSDIRRVIHEWRHKSGTPYRRVLLPDGTTEVQFHCALSTWIRSNDALAGPQDELFLRVAEPVPAGGVQLNEWKSKAGETHRRLGYADGGTAVRYQWPGGSAWHTCNSQMCLKSEPAWRWQPHVTEPTNAASAAPSAKDLQAEVAALKLQTNGDAGRIHVLRETRDALLEDIRMQREEIRCLKQSLELSQKERERLVIQVGAVRSERTHREQTLEKIHDLLDGLL